MINLEKTLNSAAIDAANYLVKHHDEFGEYNVQAHWGPEGEIYRALSVWALLAAYRINNLNKYLTTSRAILDRYRRLQLHPGCWALRLGSNGLRFKVSETQRMQSALDEDPIISGAVLKAINQYQCLSGDDQFSDLANSCMTYMEDAWSMRKGDVLGLNLNVNKLRSVPESYNFMVLRGLISDENTNPIILKQVQDAVKRTFLNYDLNTMPLMFGYHALVLTEFLNHDDFNDIIFPNILHYINNNPFKSEEYIGGYGHHDGLRGLCFTELHLRSTVGVIMACNAIERMSLSNSKVQSVHSDALQWMHFLKDKTGGFFEFYDTETQQRLGKGSVGQYASIFGILGLE